jgi:hypothetical protein
MNVKIETTLIDTYPSNVEEFNRILKCALNSDSLDKLEKSLNLINLKGFRFGFGNNHCWVKEFHSYGTLCENRLLFITEK